MNNQTKVAEDALNHRVAEALVKPQPGEDTSTNPAQKRCITVSAKGMERSGVDKTEEEGEREIYI